AQSAISSVPAAVDVNPRTLLPALRAVRALRLAPESANPLTEFVSVGTRARAKLGSAAQATYDRMLLGPFQRQIAKAIDSTLREGSAPQVQYEALRTYEMLRDPAHFDGAGVRVFVMSYWNSALQPPLSPGERAALSLDLDALLGAGAVGSAVQLEP